MCNLLPPPPSYPGDLGLQGPGGAPAPRPLGPPHTRPCRRVAGPSWLPGLARRGPPAPCAPHPPARAGGAGGRLGPAAAGWEEARTLAEPPEAGRDSWRPERRKFNPLLGSGPPQSSQCDDPPQPPARQPLWVPTPEMGVGRQVVRLGARGGLGLSEPASPSPNIEALGTALVRVCWVCTLSMARPGLNARKGMSAAAWSTRKSEMSTPYLLC